MALRSERSSLAETDAFVVLFHSDDGRSLSGKMKCVERMASVKFRLVLLFIVIMVSSLLMEDIRSEV